MYLPNHAQLVPGETLLLPPSAPGGASTRSEGTKDTHLGLRTNEMSMTAHALPSSQILQPTSANDHVFTHQYRPPCHLLPHDNNPTSSTTTINRNQNGSNRIFPHKPALIVINPGHISDDGSQELKLHRSLASLYPQRLDYQDTALRDQTIPSGYHCLSTEKPKDAERIPENNISNRRLDSNAGGAFHVVQQSKRCEGNDAKSPGSPKSSLHRPTLTIVPPPIVPDLPADGGKVEIFTTNQNYGRTGNNAGQTDDDHWLSQLQHQQHSDQRSLQQQQQYEHLKSPLEQEQQHKKRDCHRSPQNQEQSFQYSPSLQYLEHQQEQQAPFQHPKQVYEHQTSFQHQMPRYEHQTSLQHQKQVYEHQTSLQHQKQVYDHKKSLQQDFQLQQQRNHQRSQKIQHQQSEHQRSSPLPRQANERQTFLQQQDQQYEHQRSLQQDIQQQQQQQYQPQQHHQWRHQRLQQGEQYQNEHQSSSQQNRNHNMIPNHNETTSPFDMVNNSSRDHNSHQRHYYQHFNYHHPPQKDNNLLPAPSDISLQPSAFSPTSSASLAKSGSCKIPVIVISSSPVQKQERQETSSPDPLLLSPRHLEVPSLRSRTAASTLLVPPTRTGHQRSRSANPPKSRPLSLSGPDPPPRSLDLSRPDPPPRPLNLRRSHSQPRPLNLSTSDQYCLRHVDFQPIDKPFTPDLDMEKSSDKSQPPEPPLRISSSPHLPQVSVWQEERTHHADSSNAPSLERSARTDQGTATFQLPKLYFSSGHQEDRPPSPTAEVFISPSLQKPLPYREDPNQPSSSLSSPTRRSSNPQQNPRCVPQETNTSPLTSTNRISPTMQTSPPHYQEISHQSPTKTSEIQPHRAASQPRAISYHGDLNSVPSHDRPHPPARISSTTLVSSPPNRELSRSLTSMISSQELSARISPLLPSQSFPKEDLSSSCHVRHHHAQLPMNGLGFCHVISGSRRWQHWQI